jgi:lipopolysaccharide biosynthesis glycosyltransferase
VVLFEPEYAGEFNLHVNKDGLQLRSLRFNVEQNMHVHVHSALSEIHNRSCHIRDAADINEESCDGSSHSVRGIHHQNRAVATMISTDNYVTGALVLLWGIVNHGRVGSSHLICIVTEAVSASARNRLAKAGWDVVVVSAIESDSSDIVEEKWRQQFTKLHLFSLTNYTQILYLDADTIVKGSLERAWQCNAPLCGAPDVFHPVFFNCGVLVLTPNATELRLLLQALPMLPAHESEQSALNEYYLKRFQPLHISLNFQKHRCACLILLFLFSPPQPHAISCISGMAPARFRMFVDAHLNDISVVHYLGVKPWMCTRAFTAATRNHAILLCCNPPTVQL